METNKNQKPAINLNSKTTLDKIEGLTPREFFQLYVIPRKPVIIVDAIKDWGALKKWTPEFWMKEYGDRKVSIEGKVYTLKEVIKLSLSSSLGNPSPYYRNIRMGHEYPELEKDIFPDSKFCKPNWFDSIFFRPIRNSFMAYGQYELFIGGKGRSFPYLHFDTPGADTFIHQIVGEKAFIMFKPEDGSFLYPKSGSSFNVSGIPNIENVSLDEFPLYKNAERIDIKLNSGETLYFPTGWWHTARMESFSISLGIDVSNNVNWGNVIHFLSEKAKQKNTLIAALFMSYIRVVGLINKVINL